MKANSLRITSYHPTELRQSLLITALVAVVIGFLCWPMIFTSSGFEADWTHHLWFLWRQGVMIEHNHWPSLFLNNGGAVYYPLYTFYGGTAYALFGALSVVLGQAPLVAYVISYMAGFAASFGGLYKLARMAGLGRWYACVPGLLFITSPYYLTLIYARGDWPEFLGVSSIPLVVAAGLQVLLAERLSLRWAFALALSTVVLFGSHNLTMLWAVTALVITAAALLVAVPRARQLVRFSRLLRVAAIVVPAALVNAWYLLPAIAYQNHISIAATFEFVRYVRGSIKFVSFARLFTLSRATVARKGPDFALSLPVLAVAWVLLSMVVSCILKGDRVWRAVLWTFAAVGLGFGILMTHAGLVLDLPRPYTLIQFSYRLETYVLLATCAAVTAALALARTWPRAWRRAWSAIAIAVVVVGGVGGFQQVNAYPRGTGEHDIVIPDRYFVFNPKTQPPFSGGLVDYSDSSLPVVELPSIKAAVEFPPEIYNETVTEPISVPAGTPLYTDLSGGPYLVKVDGARVLGRERSRHIVLMAEGSTHQITLSPSNRRPVVYGRLISKLALLALALGGPFVMCLRIRVWLRPRRRTKNVALNVR
jgi:hypothetical protein